jgi:kynurenine formamidase
MPADIGFLQDIFGIVARSKHPVGDTEKPRPALFEYFYHFFFAKHTFLPDGLPKRFVTTGETYGNLYEMIISIDSDERTWDIDNADPIDISIPLNFNGAQPNAYGVAPAVSSACAAGDLVGDTRRGGSCNFEQYTLIPHCNGTHTECVGHITHERISVRDCLQDVFIQAVLISVSPEKAGDNDLVISKDSIEVGMKQIPNPTSGSALIIRTLPNDDSKLTRVYLDDIPPYFTAEAMEYMVELGVKHLLVDLPSIDRIYDEGKLANHRIFWNVEPGSFEINENTRVNNTITELIYVPNEVEDGNYLLNLQIAPFEADASPSRPVIFKVR